VLGKGGMGLVYKVEQIFLGQELALKTIDKGELTDISLRRFQTEARAVFSVNHPNIVALHDFGLLDETTPFMVMELATGRTLAEILQDRSLTLDEALSLFIQVCFGLAHAHENGVIHRDIKPSNIMLMDGMPWGTEGSVKILDFGIAKLVHHEEGEIQALTRTGEIFGSPLYMSPEQCLGGKVDHRSDI
jgi:serine/threonine-protein kinase